MSHESLQTSLEEKRNKAEKIISGKTGKVSAETQTIKYADIIDNSGEILFTIPILQS